MLQGSPGEQTAAEERSCKKKKVMLLPNQSRLQGTQTITDVPLPKQKTSEKERLVLVLFWLGSGSA